MTHINHNLKMRRKNMRCAKFECDMAKAIVGSFKETIEDNKRMKDALFSFQTMLNGSSTLSFLLDCNDNEVNALINDVYNGIQKLKEKCNGKSK